MRDWAGGGWSNCGGMAGGGFFRGALIGEFTARVGTSKFSIILNLM